MPDKPERLVTLQVDLLMPMDDCPNLAELDLKDVCRRILNGEYPADFLVLKNGFVSKAGRARVVSALESSTFHPDKLVRTVATGRRNYRTSEG